ncbi:MAG: C4-type zinc ribbon domain-containing protein [Anaerolineales bacterium]|jgi:predicted  nucleic acid-binding Zn-ribbon protein
MSAALGLYRLQIVDSRMDEIRTRLEEIRQILENDQEMRQAKKRVTETKATLQLAQHSLKQAEAEVDKQKIKIEQSESNLYSGNVKNPKELQDLQNEVAALKRHLETLEDRQLEAMLEEESAEQTHQATIKKMERVKARLADQNQTLTNEQSDLNKDLERLDAERGAALSPLDANLLTVYDQLRKDKRGLAIAAVNDGACAACGTTLTPAQLQSARSTGQITNCPTCGRVLYAN